MKQYVKYQSLVIASKLRVDIRITVDDARPPEYRGDYNGDKSTSLSLFPIISISLTKPYETDDTGNRVKIPWNPNDSLGMTKFQFPTFIDNMKEIQKDLKIVELYTYQGANGKRLEINEDVALKIRKVFLMGNTTVELSAVVIITIDDERLEGVKMKFNNEQSSVLLTLNELDSLIYNLDTLNIDTTSLLLYTNYINAVSNKTTPYEYKQVPLVDIAPIESDIKK